MDILRIAIKDHIPFSSSSVSYSELLSHIDSAMKPSDISSSSISSCLLSLSDMLFAFFLISDIPTLEYAFFDAFYIYEPMSPNEFALFEGN